MRSAASAMPSASPPGRSGSRGCPAPADSDAPGAPSLSIATRRGLLAAAFQRDGACFYLRMSVPSAAPPGQADQVWLAPADDQTAAACDGRHALAASGLYGVNGAAEG